MTSAPASRGMAGGGALRAWGHPRLAPVRAAPPDARVPDAPPAVGAVPADGDVPPAVDVGKQQCGGEQAGQQDCQPGSGQPAPAEWPVPVVAGHGMTPPLTGTGDVP